MGCGMSGFSVRNLLRTTLTNPREGARQILAQGFSTQELWMALTLISITMSAMVSGLFHLIPVPEGARGEVIRSMLFYSSPIGFALLNLGNAVLSIFVLFWSGRMFGGTGQIRDVLSVIVLFQATVIALLFVISIASALLPFVAALAFVLFAVWAIWAMISVIAVAHDFRSIGKAIAVFLMATIVVPFGISVILGAIMSPFIGAP